MGYSSRRGRRPDEYASKSSHTHVVQDPSVQEFLAGCNLPKRAGAIDLSKRGLVPFEPVTDNPIKHVIALDSGFNEVAVQTEFPSATICFYQFGALIFSVQDLEGIDAEPFIDPEDMSKLKRIQRLKFTMPVRNVTIKTESTLTNSVRKAVYNFFRQKMDDGELIETLRWFIYQEYSTPVGKWVLASCPVCRGGPVTLDKAGMSRDYSFVCDLCGDAIYLTDVFRLHEAIDDELGAGGILGYVGTTFEQLIMVHLIRLILGTKPSLLEQIIFIKDGPLAFFGQTANMHKPMRSLVKFLLSNHSLYLAGLEKSGAFVEHADEISGKLASGSILVLDNDYIYSYILPGKADPANPYGRTTYYGNKLIFKTGSGAMYVVSIPTPELIAYPTAGDLPHMQQILTNIEKLKCDMYDNSLIPVALVNKLVSLANHPSSRILQKFAIGAIHS